MFKNFFNLDLKAVLDRQPLVGTGPLLDWLRNLAQSRVIETLDTFRDNLCQWRCIAVHQGTRPDRSTAAACLLAQGFFGVPCRDCPKTSLNELDKVEQHLNVEKPFEEWLGIHVYEPERDADVIWYLKRNAPKKILRTAKSSNVFTRCAKGWRSSTQQPTTLERERKGGCRPSFLTTTSARPLRNTESLALSTPLCWQGEKWVPHGGSSSQPRLVNYVVFCMITFKLCHGMLHRKKTEILERLAPVVAKIQPKTWHRANARFVRWWQSTNATPYEMKRLAYFA